MVISPEQHRTDEALSKNQKTRVKIILLSLFCGTIILFLKFWAYRITGSAALKSDAIESIVNCLAALFAFGAIVFGERPADESHPYGHGKIEHFSAAFEGGLISLASVFILYEAIHIWLEGPKLENLSLGLAINLGAGAINGILGYVLVRFGRRTRSAALEADGHHVLSDFYTTLGIGSALVLSAVTGFTWLDPLVALVIGLFLAKTGFSLVRSSSQALLDMEDPSTVRNLVDVVNRIRSPEIIAIHELRTMRSGRRTHVDIHVVVPEFLEVGKAHDLVEHFGVRLLATAGLEGECHTHIDPCQRLYCKTCAYEPCPVRAAPYQSEHRISLMEAIAQGPNEDMPLN